MTIRDIRILRLFLYATIGVATIGTGLVISDRLFDTTYWPNTAEYGQNLLIFALTIYVLAPDQTGQNDGDGLLLSRYREVSG